LLRVFTSGRHHWAGFDAVLSNPWNSPRPLIVRVPWWALFVLSVFLVASLVRHQIAVKQCSEPIAAAAGHEQIEDGCNASTVLTYASGPQFSSKKLPVLSFGSAIIATTLVTVEVFAGP